MSNTSALPSWRTSSVLLLGALAVAIVLMPLLTGLTAASRVRAALASAQRESAVMRQIYDFSFAFRSLQVNAQNILLTGETAELRERYDTSRELVSTGVDELAAIPALWGDANEPVALRDALRQKIATFDEALAARRAGDLTLAQERATASAADFGTRRIFGAMMGRQRARVETASASAESALQVANRSGWWGAGMQFVLLIAAAFTIGREVRRRAGHEREIDSLNAQLREQVARVSTANEELQAFNYHVAHDLRAPIRHIAVHRAHLDALVAQHGGDEQKRAIAGITRSTERMGRLIDGLLEYARLGRATITRSAVDTGALVDSLIAQERAANPQRDVRYERGTLPVVQGDPVLLQSVFHNLLDNALKFTRDRATAEIRVTSEPVDAGKAIRFVMADNGIGFQPGEAHQLFGVFRQLHGREFPGSGVGLAMVRRIVERLGGAVRGDGTPGQGAVFSFTLPAQSDVDEGKPA
jgi:signal transduction histidine kinase